jgi:hypothetical protein
MVGRQRGVVQPELAHHARAIVFDDDVRAGEQAPERPLRRLGLQVQYDAALAAVHRVEGRAVGARGAGHAARRVAIGRLDLDHVSAHIA